MQTRSFALSQRPCRLAGRQAAISTLPPRCLRVSAQPDQRPAPGLSSAPDLVGSKQEQDASSSSTTSVSSSLQESSVQMPFTVIASLAGLGTLETGYLTLSKILGSTPVCPISGCETVLNSSYSELFGVPLSLLGMLTYAGVAAAALVARQQRAAGQEVSGTFNTGLAAGAATLAGVSGMLIYILQTQFAGDPCVWCYSSAGLSFSILVAVTLGMPSRQLASAAGPGLGLMASAVLALYLGFGGTGASTANDDFELPYSAPEVTTESSSQAVALAKRLRAAGAEMYGAFWCSHCFDQKQTFGKQAMADFPYVECYPNGWKKGVKVVEACETAGVRAFPTWSINGKTVEGELTLDALEAELASPERVAPLPPKSPFADS